MCIDFVFIFCMKILYFANDERQSSNQMIKGECEKTQSWTRYSGFSVRLDCRCAENTNPNTYN